MWTIQYREPICGGNREVKIDEETLMNALAIFNTRSKTSGFDTPIRASNGEYTFTMQGRYSVPQLV